MTWLCTCGHGSLDPEELPPDNCPLCGFDLFSYFESQGIIACNLDQDEPKAASEPDRETPGAPDER